MCVLEAFPIYKTSLRNETETARRRLVGKTSLGQPVFVEFPGFLHRAWGLLTARYDLKKIILKIFITCGVKPRPLGLGI